MSSLDLHRSTLAVTGATGFLGRYVVDVLEDRGARVAGVVRSPDKAPELPARGTELRRADLLEPDALAEAFRGADAVVSVAALFSLTVFDYEKYIRTNLEGTRNVIQAAAKAGVGRVVHVSSVAVYRGRAKGLTGEEHPTYDGRVGRRPWNAYAISKALAEQEAWDQARSHGLALTCLRPSGIYGAFDDNFMRVHKALACKSPVSVYPVFMRLPTVYAADVGDAIARALETPESAGRAYNTAGLDTTAWEFLKAWERAGGKTPALTIPVPVPLRRRFDNGRAERELGWRNRPMEEGLRETLAAEAAGRRARRIGLVSATQAASGSGAAGADGSHPPHAGPSRPRTKQENET